MKNLYKYSIFVLLAGLLSACGDSDTTTSESKSSETTSSETTVDTFDGSWAISPICEDDSYSADGIITDLRSSDLVLTINGYEAVVTQNVYSQFHDCRGDRDQYITTIALTYGAELDDASPICSNTQEVNATVISYTVNDIAITPDALSTAIAADDIPTLDSFGIICTSDDGTMLYSGDDESGTKLGDSEETRPTLIDDEVFLTRQ